MDATYIFINIVFSFIGLAYVSYGKKTSPYFLFAGIMLLIFTYFISSTFWTIFAGVGLVILPFILDRIHPY